MLHFILSCIHFLIYTAVSAWTLLTNLGYLAVLFLSEVFSIFDAILNVISILGIEFQHFVYMIEECIVDTIFICRLLGDTFIGSCCNIFNYITKTLVQSVLTRETLKAVSKNLVNLLLRAVNLIGDIAWWLVTLLPKTIYKLSVAAVDFCLFILETATQRFSTYLVALFENATRIAIGGIVLLILCIYLENISVLLFRLLEVIKDKTVNILRICLRWPRSFSTPSFPQRSLRRSLRRSLSPTDDSKLLDHQRCVVCKTRAKCVLIWPCRHLCLCEACTDVMNEQNMFLCPLCRSNVEVTISVYM